MESIAKSNVTCFAGIVTIILDVAACSARPLHDAHGEAPRDIAVQITDDGSGPRRAPPEPLVRTPADAAGDAPHAEAPAAQPLSNLHEPARVHEPARLHEPAPMHERAPTRELARIRTLALAQARLSLTIAPASLAPWLASIGATRIETSSGVDDVRAEVPAARVEELLARPDVLRVAAAAEARSTTASAAWNGLQMQEALGSARLRAVGLDGRRGGRTPGGIKIGIIEVEADRGNWPVTDHPGWNGRLAAVRDCQVEGCPTAPAASRTPSIDPNHTTHGTAVAWVAAGSIEEGQDGAFPGQATSDQRTRSGNLGAATLVFYGANGSDAVARAIDRAVDDGMDVVNMSLAIGDATTFCDPGFDPSGINAHLRAALDAGVVLVASAGNDGSAGCTVGYPAFRPEVLSIGALGSADASAPYESLSMWDDHPGVGSARGRVDLVAPGCMSGFFTIPDVDGERYFMGPGGPCGTSLAAPAGAALVGGLRSALADYGVPIDDGRSMIAQALLLGDGWDPDRQGEDPECGLAKGGLAPSGMSTLSGAGRVRTRWPGDHAGPSGWGFRAITIQQGETVTWRVGHAASPTAGVSRWRWAVAQTPSNLEDVPAIELHVEDTCTGAVLASDTTHGVRARFALDADVRCLRMRAYGAHVPREGATFYSADMHDGDMHDGDQRPSAARHAGTPGAYSAHSCASSSGTRL